MIPYPYNMVDMGGIDLAEANGTVVEGLYSKIVEAVNACGDVVLYNWKFAEIEISPQHTSILLGDPIIINGAIQVTEQDEVTVPGINPDPPEPPEPPEPPVLVPLSVTENGEYDPSDYNADGFSTVSVDVEGAAGVFGVRVFTHSAGGNDASLDIQMGMYDVTFTPYLTQNLPYTRANSYVDYGLVEVMYSSPSWTVRAKQDVECGGIQYRVGETIASWRYNVTNDILVIRAS